ncbi:MAG: IclR family transcriptional regulator [Acetobacteraceae bacterium]|nr:IclR family transcriptional regulator [Acetobacteraceae bacterium]
MPKINSARPAPPPLPAEPAKRLRGRPRSSSAAPDAAGVQSVERAALLLRLVAEGNGLALTEVAEQARLPASTAYRMLTTLEAQGMVEFAEREQLWFIGLETFRIGSAFLRRRKLAEQGRQVIQALMTESGETASLGVAEALGVVFISQVETHEAIRAFFRPGTQTPYHCSGIGKAVLAWMPPARLDALLGRGRLAGFTPATLTTRAALAEDLARTRARGFAVDDEERHRGMRCVAAAVFNEFAEPIGGVSVSGPTVRMDDPRVAEIGPRVREAAARLTRAMGGRAPAPE